jgi:hypothetical protein
MQFRFWRSVLNLSRHAACKGCRYSKQTYMVFRIASLSWTLDLLWIFYRYGIAIEELDDTF